VVIDVNSYQALYAAKVRDNLESTGVCNLVQRTPSNRKWSYWHTLAVIGIITWLEDLGLDPQYSLELGAYPDFTLFGFSYTLVVSPPGESAYLVDAERNKSMEAPDIYIPCGWRKYGERHYRMTPFNPMGAWSVDKRSATTRPGTQGRSICVGHRITEPMEDAFDLMVHRDQFDGLSTSVLNSLVPSAIEELGKISPRTALLMKRCQICALYPDGRLALKVKSKVDADLLNNKAKGYVGRQLRKTADANLRPEFFSFAATPLAPSKLLSRIYESYGFVREKENSDGRVERENGELASGDAQAVGV